MQSWAQTVAPAIAHEFYDWQFEFPHMLSFFQGMAQKKGVSLAELRSVLENAQTGYFVSIFRGADGNWGVMYIPKPASASAGPTTRSTSPPSGSSAPSPSTRS